MKPIIQVVLRFFKFLFLVLIFSSCVPSYNDSEKTSQVNIHIGNERYKGTLKNIKNKGYLRVLTKKNSFNYFMHQGKQAGYEYEMVKSFVKHLNQTNNIKNPAKRIRFKMIPVDADQLIPLLEKGYGDLIAAGLTKTKKRKKDVIFSSPYNKVSEVIVHHPNQEIQDLKDLSGKYIYIRKSSSYKSSLKSINAKFIRMNLKPIKIKLVSEDLSTETILELVSLNKYQITVADSHIAEIASKVFTNLVVNKNIKTREDSEIAWAVSPRSNGLLKSINQFLPNFKKGSLYGNIKIGKYFEHASRLQSYFDAKDKKQISKYDNLFKHYAKMYNWDWRIITALAFQESRFKQNAKNKSGAIGVMQIKRFVASEPYVKIKNIEGKNNYEQNIHAGVKYLTWIRDTYFDTPEISEKDKVRFSLAAYNAGPSRVRKARKKAKAMGHNPNQWFREVEYVMLSMKKIEPVNYVSSISQHVLAYTALGLKNNWVI